MSAPHIPVLRHGVEYESLDQSELRGIGGDEVLARISQSNAGMIKRDLRRAEDAAAKLRALSSQRLIEICKEAGELFLSGELPLNQQGDTQTADDYVATLSRTSGLPHVLVRRNMKKIWTVLDGMAGILRGLMRGMDPAVVETGFGEHCDIPVYYAPTASALGVVLPSNSPGVNSIWIPSLALGVPVVLKPGREDDGRSASRLFGPRVPRAARECLSTRRLVQRRRDPAPPLPLVAAAAEPRDLVLFQEPL